MKTPQLPVPALAQALGLSGELWLKREDLHKSGSHKGRSIPLMIKEYARLGKRDFVISSSGNAALSAIIDVMHYNKNKPSDPISLMIYIGERIDPEKERCLHDTAHDSPHITITKTTNPKQAAFQAGTRGAVLLRQSTDDLALRGYGELADELGKIPHLSALFLPVSSGTTAQGLFDGFKRISSLALPELHVAQTPSCHPIIDAIRTVLGQPRDESQNDETSLATSIVDNIAHRAVKVAQCVAESRGMGWIITNDEIQQAIELVKKTIDLDISPTSALSIAALRQAIKAGWTTGGATVCIITGK